MSPRLAGCLVTLRSQINAYAKNRNRVADGWIGDAAHSARTSDHNPDSRGIVHAIDVTNDTIDDPKLSNDVMPGQMLADALVASNDYRIKYLIFNRRIWSPNGKGWRPYSGLNPHVGHVHVSVNVKGESDVTPWKLSFLTAKVDDMPLNDADKLFIKRTVEDNLGWFRDQLFERFGFDASAPPTRPVPGEDSRLHPMRRVDGGYLLERLLASIEDTDDTPTSPA